MQPLEHERLPTGPLVVRVGVEQAKRQHPRADAEAIHLGLKSSCNEGDVMKRLTTLDPQSQFDLS